MLVEYGASDEAKAGFLLRERNRAGAPVFQAYVPIDVAVPALEQMRARLRRQRPDLLVFAIPADFMDAVALPAHIPSLPRLGFFPGSTIGNLDPPDAQRFLRQARETLGAASSFLIGVDLRKDPAVLLPAYDDKEGVTAAFNRNLLVRLNREAGADFDLDAFAHHAVWNDAESRIEMHLVSRREQQVRSCRADDPIRARRDDPHREQLQICARALRRAGRSIRMALRGTVDRSSTPVFAAPAGAAARPLSRRSGRVGVSSPVR